jgi:hypothetical protein
MVNDPMIKARKALHKMRLSADRAKVRQAHKYLIQRFRKDDPSFQPKVLPTLQQPLEGFPMPSAKKKTPSLAEKPEKTSIKDQVLALFKKQPNEQFDNEQIVSHLQLLTPEANKNSIYNAIQALKKANQVIVVDKQGLKHLLKYNPTPLSNPITAAKNDALVYLREALASLGKLEKELMKRKDLEPMLAKLKDML